MAQTVRVHTVMCTRSRVRIPPMLVCMDQKGSAAMLAVRRSSIIVQYYFYHPPTKLKEGNVFTVVCLSTGVGGYVSSDDHQVSLAGWTCPTY